MLFRVGKGLAAAAVHTLGGHDGVFVADASLDIALFFGVRSQSIIDHSIGGDKTDSKLRQQGGVERQNA